MNPLSPPRPPPTSHYQYSILLPQYLNIVNPPPPPKSSFYPTRFSQKFYSYTLSSPLHCDKNISFLLQPPSSPLTFIAVNNNLHHYHIFRASMLTASNLSGLQFSCDLSAGLPLPLDQSSTLCSSMVMMITTFKDGV